MPLRAASMAAAPLYVHRSNFLSPSQHHQLPPLSSSTLLLKGRLNSDSKRRRFVLISFGVVGLGSGVTLLAYGFGAYFNILPGSEWSALMLTYGFPVAVIGMALKYAELKPVPCVTYSDAEMVREKCATPVLKQVKTDVTRFRYGDEQHLDEALKRIFQYGQGGGIARRSAPVLQMIREEVTEDGKYCLVLAFKAKDLQLSDFERRQAKFASFFGPGITAEVGKGADDLYEVRLISNTQA
uniref:Thylakoid membrane protein slr0575 n=1 Tax=Chenopodium quinoa TaxID=63459 RepID=A0A803LKP1_CHEQI